MAEGGLPSHATPPQWMDPVVGQGHLEPWTPRWAGTRPRPGLSTCLDAALGPAGRSAAPHESPRPSDSLKINLLQRFPPAGVWLCSRSVPNGPGPRGTARRGAQPGAALASRCRRPRDRNVPRLLRGDGRGPAVLPWGRSCSKATHSPVPGGEGLARCPHREEAAGDGLSPSGT